MTTVSSVIKDALRETNLIGINATPTSAEYAEGLSRLQAVVSSVFGYEAGENLSPIRLEDIEDTIPSNSRLMLTMTVAKSLNMPCNPSDGARLGVVDVAGNLATYPLTLIADGFNIEGASSLVLNEGALNREWFYRADQGNWIRLSSLSLDGAMPFPTEFDDMFITMLSMRLNPRSGKQLSPESIEAMRRSKRQFQARYAQIKEVPAEQGLLRLSTGWFRYYNNTSFEQGRY